MFSIGQSLTAPPVAAKPREPRREYHPRTYSEFVKGLKNNELPEVLIKPNQSIAAFEDDQGNYGDVQIIQNQELWRTISESEANVQIDMTTPTSLSDTISVFFLLTFIFFVFRTLLSGPGGAGSMDNPFLKNQEFKVEEEIKTRFEDVEGIDAAKDELEEIVDFLKQPDRYFGSGAKIPRGALLCRQLC
jgi:cell division protease FtsH